MKNLSNTTKEIISLMKEISDLKAAEGDGKDIDELELEENQTELRKLRDSIDGFHTDKPVCPHCGHVHDDDWEGFESNDGVANCEACYLDFKYTYEIKRVYDTKNYNNETL